MVVRKYDLEPSIASQGCYKGSSGPSGPRSGLGSPKGLWGLSALGSPRGSPQGCLVGSGDLLDGLLGGL